MKKKVKQILRPNILSIIWTRRSFVWLLATTDLKLRYKNSVLGFLWNFLEPLLMLGVFYVVFTSLFKNQIQYYPLYLLLGLILWYMFSRSTNMGMNSLIGRAGLLQKVYFRRELLVISSVLTTFLMLIFELGVFFVFMVIFGVLPPVVGLLFPLVLVNLFALSVGLSLLLSSLNVYFRDIQHVWTVVIQAGFFVTPLFYEFKVLPPILQNVLQFNPLVGIIEVSRALLIHREMPAIEIILFMILTTTAILFLGYAVFRRLDRKLVENL
jgi:lipopolysaccharide transport system permease protein